MKAGNPHGPRSRIWKHKDLPEQRYRPDDRAPRHHRCRCQDQREGDSRKLHLLAREINDAHAQVQYHAKGMLLEAKRAGEALLRAKEECPHGTFKGWVERYIEAPYQTAAEYMRVARIATSKNTDLRTFDGGIRAFLDQHRDRGNGHKPTTPPFTPEDAEYALKLHAMAERGGSENEREVAAKKLVIRPTPHLFVERSLSVGYDLPQHLGV